MKRALLPVASFLALCLVAPRPASAEVPGEVVKRARALGNEGLAAYRAKDYAAAQAKFDEAFTAYPAPTLGLWSARSCAFAGKLVDAAQRYRQTIETSPQVGKRSVQRKAVDDARVELHTLLPRIASLTIRIRGDAGGSVALSLDGEELSAIAAGTAQPLDPGVHRLVAQVGDSRVEIDVPLAEGEHRLIPIVVTAPVPVVLPHARALSPPQVIVQSEWWWLGLGVATLLALLALTVFARQRRSSERRSIAPPESGAGTALVPGTQFATLVPGELGIASEAIATLLSTFFRAAKPVSSGVLELLDVQLDGAAGYDYFALMIPRSGPSDPAHLLQTQHFAELASPLDVELARLPKARRKVVLAISSAVELGSGVRAKILEYRNAHDALVVPLHVGEILAAHRARALRALFEERIAALHPSEDLYADRGRPDAAGVIGMHREVQALASALHRDPCLVAVDGLPGSGKTSVVARAGFDIGEPLHELPCSPIQLRTYAELARRINERLGFGFAPGEELGDSFTRLKNGLAAREDRPILVLDDADWVLRPLHESDEHFDACREFWSGLQEFGVLQGLRVVVVSVRAFVLCQGDWRDSDNPLAKLCVRISVPRLDFETASRLIREPGIQMNVKFRSSAVRIIHQETAGNIHLVRQICSELVRRARPGQYTHRLQQLTVRATDVRRVVRAQASGGHAAFERALPWLSPLERDVLQVIAVQRPSGIDDIRQALPAADRTAVRIAVDRLGELGIVSASYRVTIPLLQRWIVAYFGMQDDRAQRGRARPLVWVAAGLVATALLTTGYRTLLANRHIETSSPPIAKCIYSIMHPARVALGVQFKLTVRVSEPCRSQADSRLLVLRSGGGTEVRVANMPFVPDIPIELKNGGAEVDITVVRATSDDFSIELLERDTSLATLHLGTDWLAALGNWGEALTNALLAIPAAAGVLATFFGDLRAHWVKLVATLGRRR